MASLRIYRALQPVAFCGRESRALAPAFELLPLVERMRTRGTLAAVAT